MFFLQAGFVTHFVLAAWLRQDRLALRFFKNRFLIFYSYFFLVCSVCVFSCCGLRQKCKAPALFGCGGLVLFFVAAFLFLPQVAVRLFWVAVFGDSLALCFFCNQFFKSYLALRCLLLLRWLGADSVRLSFCLSFGAATQ